MSQEMREDLYQVCQCGGRYELLEGSRGVIWSAKELLRWMRAKAYQENPEVVVCAECHEAKVLPVVFNVEIL